MRFLFLLLCLPLYASAAAPTCLGHGPTLSLGEQTLVMHTLRAETKNKDAINTYFSRSTKLPADPIEKSLLAQMNDSACVRQDIPAAGGGFSYIVGGHTCVLENAEKIVSQRTGAQSSVDYVRSLQVRDKTYASTGGIISWDSHSYSTQIDKEAQNGSYEINSHGRISDQLVTVAAGAISAQIEVTGKMMIAAGESHGLIQSLDVYYVADMSFQDFPAHVEIFSKQSAAETSLNTCINGQAVDPNL